MLWVGTVLASTLVFWPTVLWVSVATLMPLWIAWDEHRSHRARRRAIESALAANRVEELQPLRRIAAESLRGLDLSRDLEIVPGRLARLEAVLRRDT